MFRIIDKPEKDEERKRKPEAIPMDTNKRKIEGERCFVHVSNTIPRKAIEKNIS